MSNKITAESLLPRIQFRLAPEQVLERVEQVVNDWIVTTCLPKQIGKPTLIVTSGMHQAGKSDWARLLKVPLVNMDSVRLALFDRPHVATMEEFVWFYTKMMVKSLFFAGHTVVVLDGCFINNKRRAQWGSGNYWNTVFVHFPVNATECRRRAIENQRVDLLDAIRQQSDLMTCPSVEEDGGACAVIDYEDTTVRPA